MDATFLQNILISMNRTIMNRPSIHLEREITIASLFVLFTEMAKLLALQRCPDCS